MVRSAATLFVTPWMGQTSCQIAQSYWLILEIKKSCWGLWLNWGVRLDAKPIIHGVSESLLTSQVPFMCCST
jgi:hypothetical protein